MAPQETFAKRPAVLASRWGLIVVGLLIGIAASVLQKLGNPPNLGLCVGCFQRDVAGALGLHRFAAGQYMRPEIMGLVLGALVAAFVFGEFRPRAGSAPIARFVLGVLAMIGLLVFLGCPWRVMSRLAGGDANALLGLLGLAIGVAIASLLIASGYTLGRARPSPAFVGLIMPLVMVLFLALVVARTSFGQGGAIFFSTKGPGAMHAPLLASLAAGLLVGFLGQRSRFCIVGAIRSALLNRSFNLLLGVAALVVGTLVMNLVFGQFKPGLAAPIAHSSGLWNMLGMVLAGLAFTLGGGCPGRQLFLAGEGDGDAAVFTCGMIAGAGIAHSWRLGAAPDKLSEGAIQAVGGPGSYGQIAVIVGIVFCIFLGLTARQKASRNARR